MKFRAKIKEEFVTYDVINNSESELKSETAAKR